MTATERLRQLLDERGVEWSCDFASMPRSTYTHFEVDSGMCVSAWESEGKLGLSVETDYRFTPEQAVEATLGRGTCKMEQSWNGVTEVIEYECVACGEFAHVEIVKPDGAQAPNYCPNCGRRVVEQ